MSISYTTARWAAPACFLTNFASQTYGILSTPNMKDINDANLSFFSPHPLFIAGFFFPQQLLQIAWLYRMWKLDSSKPKERAELDQLIDFVPYYIVGNLSIAAWMLVWNSSHLGIADAFVAINTLTQLYYMILRLPPMNTQSTSSILTHLLSKTLAGLGVLDLLHNTSAAFFKEEYASLLVKILTGVGFGLASATSDWIFGACLAYVLVAMAVGQLGLQPDWGRLLGLYAVGATGIVVVKNLAVPPYKRDYAAAPTDEND